ncbi:MAG: peptidoglycan DD-metalloendopeptidase family protein [Candidatus Sungbacteria bacterium]|nr:peptidoglycan DD-metalloendopeptidase family protein [Candidatus Sungbacteria bacterium]
MRAYALSRGSLFLCLAAVSVFLACPVQIGAAEPAPGELQSQIEAKTKEIKALEAEAEKYRQTIATTEAQANTLKNQIARINSAIAKLQNDIKLTERQIQRTNLEIKSLKFQITDTASDISEHQERLKELVRLLDIYDHEHPLEILLKNRQLSEFFNRIQSTINLQDEVRTVIDELRTLKGDLSHKKSASEVKVIELKREGERLNDAKALQVNAQSERAKILAETQNQEKKYQELLAENERRRGELEAEVFAFENKLRITLDPNALPKRASGVLDWPLPKLAQSLFQCGHTVLAFLTQCFGDTSFARSGGYNGKGHNGVDFRANATTEIYSAEKGVVRGVGDTDTACRGASYGRWVLIDHENGLATLYAHLSLARVSPGRTVERGEVIGYAGKTGYATGPHLHFSVFARSAVNIGVLPSRVCKRNMTLPLSPFNGYLNPLDYL